MGHTRILCVHISPLCMLVSIMCITSGNDITTITRNQNFFIFYKQWPITDKSNMKKKYNESLLRKVA